MSYYGHNGGDSPKIFICDEVTGKLSTSGKTFMATYTLLSLISHLSLVTLNLDETKSYPKPFMFHHFLYTFK